MRTGMSMKMRFQLAIEDSPEMAVFLSQRMGIPVLLFDRPWNRSTDLDGSVQRCGNWQHIRRAVDAMTGWN